MNTKRVAILTILLTIIAILAAGCSSNNSNIATTTPTNSVEPDSSVKATGNPFDTNNPNTSVLGRISHGFANPQLDKQGKMVPLQYNGGEMKINYRVAASGKAKNVGFLLFIDGQPQPYKFNTTERPYEYMHIFDLQNDDQETPFTFMFTPITGKKGDSLHVTIVSVYNPAFIPDMKENSSYGGYQTTLEAGGTILFNKDAGELAASSVLRQEVLSNVRLSKEPVTQELLDNQSGLEAVNQESLDKKVYSETSVDGNVRLDNYQIKKSGTIHISFKMFGHPGTRYRNTFYINHQPLSNPNGDSFETALTKGNVEVINADIKAEDLGDFNTFYVISIPVNADDFPNDVVVLEKTPSLLLYKGLE